MARACPQRAKCSSATDTSRLNLCGAVLAGFADFRGDLATISIPILIIHGDQDRVLPYEATGSRLPALLKNTRSIIITSGPHGRAG